MKKHTRLAAFLAALLLMIPFFGCSDKAADTPDGAIQKTLALQSYSATVEEIRSEGDGQSTTCKILGLAVENSGDHLIFEAGLTDKTASAVKNVEVYCNGNWYYVDDCGLYFKSNTPALTAPYDYHKVPGRLVKILPDVVWEKSGDGQKATYTATLSAESTQMLDEDIVKERDAFSSVQVTVEVQKGYMTYYALRFAYETGDVYTYAFTCQKPGEKASATPPAGYQNYPEHSFS